MPRGVDLLGNPEKARIKGRNGGLANKGKRKGSAIIKEQLTIREISDLKEVVLKNFEEFSNHKDVKIRAFAAKEIAKYLFPQKREHSGEISGNITVNFKY